MYVSARHRVPHGLFHVDSAGLAPVLSAERDVSWRQRLGGHRGADSQFLSVPTITGCLLVTVRLAPCGPAGLLVPGRPHYPQPARPGSRLPWPPAFWLHLVCRFWWAGSLSARAHRGPRNLEEQGSGRRPRLHARRSSTARRRPLASTVWPASPPSSTALGPRAPGDRSLGAAPRRMDRDSRAGARLQDPFLSLAAPRPAPLGCGAFAGGGGLGVRGRTEALVTAPCSGPMHVGTSSRPAIRVFPFSGQAVHQAALCVPGGPAHSPRAWGAGLLTLRPSHGGGVQAVLSWS